MRQEEAIIKRQKFNTRFKNADMDFIFNWAIGVSHVLGMSPSQVFHAVHGIRDGDPAAWRAGFRRQGDCQRKQAAELARQKQNVLAGQFAVGAAYAYRFALQYTDPTGPEFQPLVEAMEQSFQQGMDLLGVPLRAIEVPFENTTLPGYYLEHDRQPRPVVVMVGGGETFREDLFPFAGYPGWKRGYNVLMVDLPGEGVTPNRGQYFRADMEKPVSTVLDWLEANAAARPAQVAAYGVSGGGYFTALAVVADPRITAWVASTPIFDMAEVFRREFGPALKAPGWLLNVLLRLAGSFNKSAEINLRTLAWRGGCADFKAAADRVLAEAKVVDYAKIRCPSLFLVSDGEAEELRRQARVLYDDFSRRGVDVTLREFTAAEGADGHRQVNNLRLAHMVIFDWLDRVFGHDSGDVRRYC